MMSVSPPPKTRLPKSEPDLFFPASDSEEEDDVIPIDQPSSTTLAGPSSCSTAIKGDGSHSSLAKNGSNHSNGDSKPLIGSQGSDIIPLDSTPSLTIPSQAGPSTHKRPSPAHSPSTTIPSSFASGYLGEFVCEGWSLSKGKGYCLPGSKVIFERPKPAKGAEDNTRSINKVGPARLVNGKVVNAKGKVGANGKQVKLGALGVGKKAISAVNSGDVTCSKTS